MNEEKTEIHLLHSNFIKQHRRILEENIMSFSRDNSSTNSGNLYLLYVGNDKVISDIPPRDDEDVRSERRGDRQGD